MVLSISGCVTSNVEMTPAEVEKKEISIQATTQPCASIILKVFSKKEEVK